MWFTDCSQIAFGGIQCRLSNGCSNGLAKKNQEEDICEFCIAT